MVGSQIRLVGARFLCTLVFALFVLPPGERWPAAGAVVLWAAQRAPIVRPTHVYQNDPETKFPRWVAYTVKAASFGPKRTRHWRADPLLPPDQTLEPADWRGAHAAYRFDRGHMAPLATHAGSPDWRSVNLLSNIVPQSAPLNRGPWARLEARVRRTVRDQGGPLHVVTGPLWAANAVSSRRR